MADVPLFQQVRAAFLYDEQTGRLRWSQNRGSRAKAGEFAGTVSPNGYVVIRFIGKLRYAHHLVWLMFHESLPEQLDHIDRNRANNRLDNLRPATNAQNRQNMGLAKNNRSGVTGVYAHRGRWCAEIKLDRRKYFLGVFDTIDAAAAARATAKRDLHTFGAL